MEGDWTMINHCLYHIILIFPFYFVDIPLSENYFDHFLIVYIPIQEQKLNEGWNFVLLISQGLEQCWAQ